ncbi:MULTISPECIES: PAAR domain-containing protein [Pseudomonas]|uniref:PAAR domain-containing protein n=1 Tax=Pseudomonas asiatica TaxID=2219225 RepID=A0A9X4HUD3_9PSED|nr:PAAR domain-containing protein [Pseudomonas asiatica]MDD2109446.1 PAAR domain-containing protein [Pseudomonas asiatica]
MIGIVRIGDKNTAGGTVLSGSSSMLFYGVGVARQGDPVNCPVIGHGRTVIAEGHPAFIDNGLAVAFDGHRCGCGCALVSSLPCSGVT